MVADVVAEVGHRRAVDRREPDASTSSATRRSRWAVIPPGHPPRRRSNRRTNADTPGRWHRVATTSASSCGRLCPVTSGPMLRQAAAPVGLIIIGAVVLILTHASTAGAAAAHDADGHRLRDRDLTRLSRRRALRGRGAGGCGGSRRPRIAPGRGGSALSPRAAAPARSSRSRRARRRARCRRSR